MDATRPVTAAINADYNKDQAVSILLKSTNLKLNNFFDNVVLVNFLTQNINEILNCKNYEGFTLSKCCISTKYLM